MKTFETIAETVTEHISDVLEEFDAVTDQEPWIHLPAEYRVNFLDEVITMAASLSLCRPHDHELCRRMLHKAAEHGQNRLEQGLSDSVIFQEMYLVRESLWRYIKRRSGDEEGALVPEAIIRIDMALSLAAKSSLRGYHRPAFEKRGDWPGVIEQLLREWAPPPPIESFEPSGAETG